MLKRSKYSLFYRIFQVCLVTMLIASLSVSSLASDIMGLSGNVYDNAGNRVNGNLTVLIYNSSTGGVSDLIYNSSSDFNNKVINGEYDITLGNGSVPLNLEYGKTYYLDTIINGENFDFNGVDRKEFQSQVGTVNSNLITQSPWALNSSLNTEISNRVGNDSYLQGQVNNLFSNDTSLSGRISSVNDSLIIELSDRQGNDTYLQGQVTNLFLNDSGLSGRIDSVNDSLIIEISDRVGNDSYLQGQVNNLFVNDSNLNIKILSVNDSLNTFYNETSELKIWFDSLYYSISNPLSYLNETSGQMFNDSQSIVDTNQRISDVNSSLVTSYNTTIELKTYFDSLYYSLSNPLNYLNETSGQMFNDSQSIVDTNQRISDVNSSLVSNYNTTTELKNYFDTLYLTAMVPNGWMNDTETISTNLNLNISNKLFVNATNGNVGIGTVSPSQKLEVNGNVNITGNIYASGNQVCTASNGLCSTSGGGWSTDGSTTTTNQDVKILI